MTFSNSTPTFLVSSVEPFNLFNISSTCFADIKALASSVSKNLFKLITDSSKPSVSLTSSLISDIGFFSLSAISKILILF